MYCLKMSENEEENICVENVSTNDVEQLLEKINLMKKENNVFESNIKILEALIKNNTSIENLNMIKKHQQDINAMKYSITKNNFLINCDKKTIIPNLKNNVKFITSKINELFDSTISNSISHFSQKPHRKQIFFAICPNDVNKPLFSDSYKHMLRFFLSEIYLYDDINEKIKKYLKEKRSDNYLTIKYYGYKNAFLDCLLNENYNLFAIVSKI